MSRLFLALPLLLAAGCGSTGSGLVTFHAAAAGPADAVAGQPLVFAGGKQNAYQVTLTRATLHVGALYLNRSVPSSGSQAQACVLPGIYSGQVTVPLTVDVLTPEPQPFLADGEGTADEVKTGEVWLFGSDPFATDDLTVIVDVAGTAVQGSTVLPFVGQITIGQNRQVAPSNPALPGTNPLCKQRIVTPVTIDFTLAQGGTLLLRVDPRKWFQNVDFAQIPADPAVPGQLKFLDQTVGPADIAFYSGIRGTSPYAFTWQPP
jgi:hypothetical protein